MATRAPKASAAPREATVKSAPAQTTSTKSTAVKSTPARNTSVPPKAKASAKSSTQVTTTVTREMIAERAYHLWQAGAPGGEFEHWCAAERELSGK